MTDQRPAGKLYGVIHLPPLPGTPFHRPGSLPGILDENPWIAQIVNEPDQ